MNGLDLLVIFALKHFQFGVIDGTITLDEAWDQFNQVFPDWQRNDFEAALSDVELGL